MKYAALWVLLALAIFASLPPMPAMAIARGADAATEAAGIIRPGHEAEALALVADVGGERVLDGGYVITDVRIDRSQIAIDLRDHEGAGALVGQVTLTPARVDDPARTKSFSIAITSSSADPRARAALEATRASIVAHDDGSLYAPSTRSSGGTRAPPEDPLLLRRVAGILAAWLLLLVIRDRLQKPEVGTLDVSVKLKLTHALPATLQLTIFAYWSLYYLEIRAHAYRMAVQIAFAYLVDFLFAWSRRRRWTFGLGLVPIVLSANLFLWFDEGDVPLYFVVVFLALASKVFLVRANGEHVFNPSAFGTSVVGLACIFFPHVFHYVDISQELAIPPNMAELIFLLALVPFVRLNSSVMSLAAFVTMIALQRLLHFPGMPWPTWPAWFLAITLFAGDPATMAKTSVGRILFGIATGAGISLFAIVLLASVGTDYFAKVLAIPIANLLVPAFDRVATSARVVRVTQALRGVVARRVLPAVLWIVAFMRFEPDSKRSGFDAAIHETNATRFVVHRGDRPPVCEDNPLFCQPFSFRRELAAWLGAPPAPETPP